jgi:hypothetical protein
VSPVPLYAFRGWRYDVRRGQEVSVAYGSTHPAQVHHPDIGVHVITWTLSALGVLAATIGAWIMLAPDDGTIGVFGRTWAARDLTTVWGPWLLIVGGGVSTAGMAISAVRDWQHEDNRWLATAEALLAVAGLAAAIAGIVILL